MNKEQIQIIKEYEASKFKTTEFEREFYGNGSPEHTQARSEWVSIFMLMDKLGIKTMLQDEAGGDFNFADV